MNPTNSLVLSDVELMQSLRGGDDVALIRLHQRHVAPVYRCVLRALGDGGEADECTQDVFLLLWKKRRSVQIYDDSLLPWLLTTAKYLALNRGRKLRRRRAKEAVLAEAEAAGLDPLATVEELETVRGVREAISALSPVDQSIIALCITEGMTYDDAASLLGVTHGVVRNRLSRARSELRRSLAGYQNGDQR